MLERAAGSGVVAVDILVVERQGIDRNRLETQVLRRQPLHGQRQPALIDALRRLPTNTATGKMAMGIARSWAVGMERTECDG